MKATIQELQTSRWIREQQNVAITGPTGVGKIYLACALGHKGCRDGFTVAYRRVSRLFDELAQARADGTLPLLLRRFAKVNVLTVLSSMLANVEAVSVGEVPLTAEFIDALRRVLRAVDGTKLGRF